MDNGENDPKVTPLLMRDSSPPRPPTHPYFTRALRRLATTAATEGPQAAALAAQEEIGRVVYTFERSLEPGSDIGRALVEDGITPDDLGQMVRYLMHRVGELRRATH